MNPSSERWHGGAPSEFPWEREALDFIREGLPDHEPYRAWPLFEVLTGEGQVYEVDLLVVAKQGFWLVEIKSRPGTVSGDGYTWTWSDPEGRRHSLDNPLLLANRKAKALASILKAQPSAKKLKTAFPWLDALVFLSHPGVRIDLEGTAALRVLARDRPAGDPAGERKGILAALLRRDAPGLGPPPRTLLDAPTARAIGRALEEAGIRPSRKSRRVGDYTCGTLLADGPGYQDAAAEHASLKGVHARVRRYLVARAASEDERQRLRSAAQREYRILRSLDHAGILKALDYRDEDTGPTILFDRDPEATRLDHHLATLARDGKPLPLELKIHILREVADAVRYAHTKGVIHRALSPESILLVNPTSERPQVKLFNFQVSIRDRLSDLSNLTNVEGLVDSGSLVYMAPEAISSYSEVTKAADVFSLGALAYRLFTGKRPGANISEVHQTLREHGGLRVSAGVDGAGPALENLIYESTRGDVDERLGVVEEFLVALDLFEEEVTAPAPLPATDPLLAKRGDRLEHGLVVERVLGKGSTALALLVKTPEDGSERVLKVALDEKENKRLLSEAEALKEIRSEFIVEVDRVLTVGSRTAILLKKAGDETLASYLAKEGRLSNDLLQRFGENLLEAVASLERHGIPHRDIKPDNIGVHSPRKQSYQLVLFDFSLARAPLDNIHLGTPPYREPFLSLRKPPRWDPAADRYSAAVTLYEMAAGSRPQYGDGRSDPAVTQAPLTLDPSIFDAGLKDGLTSFFEKTLCREVERRFRDAEEMKRAWSDVFRKAEARPESAPAAAESVAPPSFAHIRPDSMVVALGLSTRAVNALDRIEVLNVRDLVRLSLGRVYVLRGVGRKTRIEIRSAVSQLRSRFPELLVESPPPTPAPPESREVEPPAGERSDVGEYEAASLEALCQRFLAPKPNGRGEKTWAIRAALLGLGAPPRPAPGSWPSQSDVARVRGVSRPLVTQVLSADRNRWLSKDTWMTLLREEVLALIAAHGGVVTSRELTELILAKRASGGVGDPQALEMASAVGRAAAEAEQGLTEPRFVVVRGKGATFVALTEPLAQWAARLGERADAIAAEDPLVSPMRALQRLREIEPPDSPARKGAPAASIVQDDRLLHLATAASRTATNSARGELYPRGMAAERALALARGAVSGLGLGDPAKGGDEFSPEDAAQRVRNRYPEAAPLPARPALDALLRDLGMEVEWDGAKGVYRRSQPGILYTRGSSIVGSLPTTGTSRRPPPDSPEALAAREFEERLKTARDKGGFLVIGARPPEAMACEKQLVRRLGVERISCDRLLIDGLRAAAAEMRVDWSVVVDTDREGPGTADWRMLLQLVEVAVPRIEAELLRRAQPVLLVHLGLLRRYGQLILLERLRDQAGRRGVCPAVWALLVGDEQSDLPKLDGEEVPILSRGQWVRAPEEWIRNEHRGKAVNA